MPTYGFGLSSFLYSLRSLSGFSNMLSTDAKAISSQLQLFSEIRQIKQARRREQHLARPERPQPPAIAVQHKAKRRQINSNGLT